MEKIILRDNYLKKIRPFYDSQYIKVITGIRRCGKSKILSQIHQELIDHGVDREHIIFIDLESKIGGKITNRALLEHEIESHINDEKKYYIFIDEIQHIKLFEEAIASIRVSYNCSLFVTGSNSKLLKGKMQDKLTGRAKEFEILPFTYAETLQYKKENGIMIDESDFESYISLGGMPQRFEEIDEDGVRKYLIDLYGSIVRKDVFDQHKKINKMEFDNISKYIISTTGKPFSALSIAKHLKNNKTKDEQKSFSETINNYAKYLEECYFLNECRPYCLKDKERLNGVKKYYAMDSGLRNSLGNLIEIDDTFALEGIIYNELIFRGYEVRYGSFRGGEIDFVAIKNEKKCLIQVTYRINDMSTFEREYGVFNKIKDNSPKYVFSLDKKDTSNNGITHINIIDFLTGKVDINIS